MALSKAILERLKQETKEAMKRPTTPGTSETMHPGKPPSSVLLGNKKPTK